MNVLKSIAEFRSVCEKERTSGRRIGFVPTMGSMHEGHRSLLRRARADNDMVAASIYVNPLQFGPNEDLESYPRDFTGDIQIARNEGIDVVFAPSPEEMLPRPSHITVHVSGLTGGMCGAVRPGHFDGVATVVTTLFSIVGPCRAYFGRKDAQQLAIIRRLVEDLHLPITVVGCPLVREPDGLAFSSRNAYLSDSDRLAAPILFAGLRAGADAVLAGERLSRVIVGLVREVVGHEPRVELEYVEVRDLDELIPRGRVEGDVLLAVAARVGSTRLIDNAIFHVGLSEVTVDLGVVG